MMIEIARLTLEKKSRDNAEPREGGSRNHSKALGFIPNMYADMANSPSALETYGVGYNFFRSDSGFTPVEQEVVFLTISHENGCEYCMAAHSMVGEKMSGVRRSFSLPCAPACCCLTQSCKRYPSSRASWWRAAASPLGKTSRHFSPLVSANGRCWKSFSPSPSKPSATTRTTFSIRMWIRCSRPIAGTHQRRPKLRSCSFGCVPDRGTTAVARAPFRMTHCPRSDLY